MKSIFCVNKIIGYEIVCWREKWNESESIWSIVLLLLLFLMILWQFTFVSWTCWQCHFQPPTFCCSCLFQREREREFDRQETKLLLRHNRTKRDRNLFGGLTRLQESWASLEAGFGFLDTNPNGFGTWLVPFVTLTLPITTHRRQIDVDKAKSKNEGSNNREYRKASIHHEQFLVPPEERHNDKKLRDYRSDKTADSFFPVLRLRIRLLCPSRCILGSGM